MKPNDIVMIFADPINKNIPVGQAKLIELLEGYRDMELWKVEYLDQPDHEYNIFIPTK